MAESKASGFLEKFSMVSAKVGNQIHLRTLRDSFATMVPLYILAGIATLISSSVAPLILSGSALDAVTFWSSVISNGTLNFSGVIICGLAGYFLANNRRFDNPIACVVIALSSLIIMMPTSVTAALADGSGDTAEVTSALIFDNLGVKGLFAGIIIGMLSTELFIRLSNVKKLQVNLGEGIPPAVGKSFSVLIPMLITATVFAVVASILTQVFNTNLIALITMLVQRPLANLGTSLPAVLFIYAMGNLLFFFGIHQSTINGVLLEPILTVAITENMAAAAAGTAIPNLITIDDLNFFGMIGGTGSTLCLILATYIVGRSKASKAVCSMSVLPGIFNINEPMIFGYPIVYNLPMLIPYLLTPTIGIALHYVCQVLGLVSNCTVYIPWNTPVFVSGFLSTGGDIRSVILQVVIVVIGTLLYIPFVRISERAQALELEQQSENA